MKKSINDILIEIAFEYAKKFGYSLTKEEIYNPETIGQCWVLPSEKRVFGNDLVSVVCSISQTGTVKSRVGLIIDTERGADISIWHEGEWWAYCKLYYDSIHIIGNIHDNPELINK